MTMTFIFGVLALLFLLAVFIIAYRMRGLKVALGVTIAAFFSVGAFYAVLVMFITSQMR